MTWEEFSSSIFFFCASLKNPSPWNGRFKDSSQQKKKKVKTRTQQQRLSVNSFYCPGCQTKHEKMKQEYQEEEVSLTNVFSLSKKKEKEKPVQKGFTRQ